VEYEELLEAVRKGRYNEKQLREVVEVANRRIKRTREARNAAKFDELRIGDIVRFCNNVSPKYLLGKPALVVGKNETRVRIATPRDARYGDRSGMKDAPCPVGILEKIDRDSLPEADQEAFMLLALAAEIESAFNAAT
jgi:hypothetical protein